MTHGGILHRETTVRGTQTDEPGYTGRDPAVHRRRDRTAVLPPAMEKETPSRRSEECNNDAAKETAQCRRHRELQHLEVRPEESIKGNDVD